MVEGMASTINLNLLSIFVVVAVVNVILNTIRTIVTVKGGMFWSAFMSAIAFSFYTVVIIFTVCELPTWVKVVVTALANFTGTYFVKWFELKFRKDRLWMVDVVIFKKNLETATKFLNERGIQFTEVPMSNSDSHVFHIYSNTQSESREIKSLLSRFNARCVVVESKSL